MLTPMTDQDKPLAVVTGGSSGIGLCIAEELGRRGHRLAIVSRDTPRLTQALNRLREQGCAVAPYPLDLNHPSDLPAEMRGLVNQHGHPDVLVNAAGVGMYRPFLEHDTADENRLMRINYHAPAAIIRAILPGMIQRGRGHIINIGSMSTKMGPCGHATYAAAKSALVSLTQTLAADYAATGVRFSYVNPGIVDTPYFRCPEMLPLWNTVKRYAISPQRVAKETAGLLDNPRLEICVPRSYRVMDLIRAVSVGMAHRLVAQQSRPAPRGQGLTSAASV